MTHSLRVDLRSAIPIWHQIEEGVRRLVATGGLEPGASVPSVRDLARELTINPATVAKAYQRLCEAGVLLVRRGEGTFVAERPPALDRGERRRLLSEAAERYVTVARTLGASTEETVDTLDQVLRRTR